MCVYAWILIFRSGLCPEVYRVGKEYSLTNLNLLNHEIDGPQRSLGSFKVTRITKSFTNLVSAQEQQKNNRNSKRKCLSLKACSLCLLFWLTYQELTAIFLLTCPGLAGGQYVILATRNGKCIFSRQSLCLFYLFMIFKK